MSYLEKDRASEGTGWFVGIIGVIAIAQISWNLYTLVLYALASAAGIESEATAFSFIASALGVTGGVLLLIALVHLARHVASKHPLLALGCIMLIFKNVVEVLQNIVVFIGGDDRSQEALHTTALHIGSDIGQLIFWCFVLWLSKTWVPRLLLAKKTEAPKLMGAQ